MPSETLDNYRGARNVVDRRGVLIVLAIVFISAVLAAFCGFIIKVYVLLSYSVAAFKACGVGYLATLYFFSVIAFSVFCGARALYALAQYDWSSRAEENAPTLWEVLVDTSIMAIATYWLLAFGTSMIAWFEGEEPEEFLIFFAEFYVFDFSNCTSGQDLVNVELAVGLFKIENFIVTVFILLLCPCCIYYNPFDEPRPGCTFFN